MTAGLPVIRPLINTGSCICQSSTDLNNLAAVTCDKLAETIVGRNNHKMLVWCIVIRPLLRLYPVILFDTVYVQHLDAVHGDNGVCTIAKFIKTELLIQIAVEI